jgi:tetratricopeptide (TPR) repeat protein
MSNPPTIHDNEDKDRPAYSTEAEALAAVQQNGKALKFVPEALKTVEVCLAALKQDDRAREFQLLDSIFGETSFTVPKYVPKVLWNSAELCFAAVQQDREAIYFVPEVLMTAELCHHAIQEYSKAIEIDGQNAVAYAHRGSAYINNQDYDRAVADLKKALQIDPDYQWAEERLDKAKQAREEKNNGEKKHGKQKAPGSKP